MTTSFTLLALSGLLAGNTGPEKPAWLSDYAAARQLGRMMQRPLAVVVGSGQEGWERLSQDGKLGKDVNRLLAANYVCVYVNTADTNAQGLAAALELSSGPGLVISDHSGLTQAFHHQGSLSDGTLSDSLRRYAEPQRVVRHTETAPVRRVSFYPPEQPVSGYAPPAFYAPRSSAPSFSGRSC